MIYEYCCERGHVIEATVKLSGEGTPESCTVELPLGAVTNRIEQGIAMKSVRENGSPRFYCGAKLTRIMSLTSGYFPGAASWRGGR